LERLDALTDAELSGLDDRQAFELLDHKLYLGTESSLDDVDRNTARFSRFDSLTNQGESFDRTKSFIVRDGHVVRILFVYEESGFHSGRVPIRDFTSICAEFLAWIESERRGISEGAG
jgi:hypothetical protein